MLNKINKKIDIIFNFVIDDETLIKRISGRYSCSKCGMLYNKHFNNPKVEGKCDSCLSQDFKTRSDDSEEIVKNRIIVYNELSLPLLEFYKKKCLIVSVDTLKIVPLIFEDLKSNINNLKI